MNCFTKYIFVIFICLKVQMYFRFSLDMVVCNLQASLLWIMLDGQRHLVMLRAWDSFLDLLNSNLMEIHVSSYYNIQDILGVMKGMLSYKLDSVYIWLSCMTPRFNIQECTCNQIWSDYFLLIATLYICIDFAQR